MPLVGYTVMPFQSVINENINHYKKFVKRTIGICSKTVCTTLCKSGQSVLERPRAINVHLRVTNDLKYMDSLLTYLHDGEGNDEDLSLTEVRIKLLPSRGVTISHPKLMAHICTYI